MNFSRLMSRRAVVLLTTACMAIVPIFTPQEAAYAAPKLDKIRVALYISSSRYSAVEPVVTLSTSSGADISIRNQAGTKTWVSYPSPKTFRGSIDQYSVQMLETVDLATAQGLYNKLSTLPHDSYIIRRNKQGKLVYQVFYGSYSTAIEANSAMDQAMKGPGIAALVKPGSALISGPMYLNAGSYATEAEANGQVGLLSQSGFNADLVIQEDAAGTMVYSAWVGGVAQPDKLNAIKQQMAALLPQLNLQMSNTATAYLVRRWDMTDVTGVKEGVDHYAVGGTDTKALIHPIQDGITVHERSGRVYRGDVELSAFNGKMAVINELPLEQYLYSVVSSELGAGWPAEALKAQAVSARTFANVQGMKYQIAQVTDTTLDQAYYGQQKEFDAAVKAVDATKDEVIVDQSGKLISPVYSSNAGGITADPLEVWGNPLAYLRSVSSPDTGAEAGKANWFQIQLTNGKLGYVHSSYMKDTGKKNAAGLPYYEAIEAGINVRSAPYVDNTSNPSTAQLSAKQQVLVLGQEKESNAYSWVRVYKASYIENSLAANGTKLQGPLQTLEITKRGPSGRVIEMKANGQTIKVPYPDTLRTALGGLPSTLFEIGGSGEYTIEGNVGSGTDELGTSGTIYVLAAGQTEPVQIAKSQTSVIHATGEVKPLLQQDKPTTSPSKPQSVNANQEFVIKGTGYGHGLGMSQWGARGYAELGYDYKKILQAYYYGVNITKE
ncbi:Amidase enhancer precursor [compost metagenome]